MGKKMTEKIIGILFIILIYSNSFAEVTITENLPLADDFVRHTVTGITTPLPQLPDQPGYIGASYLTIVDLDNDNIKEIICTSGVGEDNDIYTQNGAVAVFKRTGADLNTWTKNVINATFAFANESVARDMDGDGDLDIMVMDNFIAGQYTGFVMGIYYLENQGGDITSPSNWVKKIIYQGVIGTGLPHLYREQKSSYHRAIFMDIDGDGKEDFITTKVCMQNWQAPRTDTVPPHTQYTWMEWFKKEGNPGDTNWGTNYSGPYAIGDGGGFLFNVADINRDGIVDVVTGQFFIATAGTCIVKGPGDPHGDSMLWFKNPGPHVDADSNGTDDVFEPWSRFTIDNWYTSPNPLGRWFEVVFGDIDQDGEDELITTNHNHQDYDEGTLDRIWPSGVYYMDVPENPESVAQWTPVTIDAGDPNLIPYDLTVDPLSVLQQVLDDPYAVNRGGGWTSQGSPGMVREADINCDGLPDLVVPGDGKGTVYYYESQGMSGSTIMYERTKLYDDPACMPGEAKFADVDNDGDLDIVSVIFDTSVAKPLLTVPGSEFPPLASSSIFIFENKKGPCNTLIQLSSFEVKPLNEAVKIVWKTDSEIHNAGFNIYRGDSETGTYTKINSSLIPANGSPTQGTSYEFVDGGLNNRKTYYYKLEDIDLQGVSTMHGPVNATPRFIFGLFQ